MCTDFIEEKKYKKIYFTLLSNDNRSIKLSTKLMDYKKDIIKSRLNEIKFDAELLDENGLIKLFSTFKSFDVIYPSIGEINDFLISNNLKNIKYLYRKIDQYAWKYCNKGFFNFKNYIPKIVKEFI